MFRSCVCIPERDTELMLRVHELRYQVYCIECGYLPSSQYPDQMETDLLDALSAHFCVFNLAGELVGYARLVRPDLAQAFPFQSHCRTLLAGATLAPPVLAAEVSRLMLRQDYRRRRGDSLAGITLDEKPARAEQDMRIHSPQILLSLYRQMYAFSRVNGIRYWYAAMEQPLARALAQMGFSFAQIGPLADYYGQVAPYLGDLRLLEERLSQSNPVLMAWLRLHPASVD